MPDLELCDWAMPEDAAVYPGHQCILEPGHDDQHVIGCATRGAMSLYGVDHQARTITLLCHADLRNGKTPSREEMAATFALLESSRRSMGG